MPTSPGGSSFQRALPHGQGTLNLNISVPAAMQPIKVAVGRYPVNPATYVLGAGATLHVPPGPGGADSPLTLPFNASQFTAHLDFSPAVQPHWIVDPSAAGMSSLWRIQTVPLKIQAWPIPIMLRLLLLLTFGSAFTLSAQTIEVKLIDGRNGHPIANSCVNVWVGNEQKDALAIPTDNDGVAPSTAHGQRR